MSDSSNSSERPTRKSDGPPTPLDGDTLDAPPAPEPGTVTAGTHSHFDDPRTASAPRAGADIGPISDPPGFVISRELGSGGMGVVYEARQTKLNRMVALKVLRSGRTDARAVIRFLTEAEAVAAIKHPNVVQVFEVGQHSGGPFMALELLTGGTLSDRLRNGARFDARPAAELLVKIAGAVQAAHDLGIVHRDLKPGNVLFDDASEPKVTDFGLAKKTGGIDITNTQALMGTPAYMAPEQARGETRFVGPPADVWALGAILYECLTGKRAFDADDTWAVLRKVTDEQPLAPRTHVPGVPQDLELIALKCLEKTPADRYPSAAALAADLENYLAGRPVSVRPAGLVERTSKWVKRNPVVAALTACVALVLVIGSVVSVAFALQAQRRGDDLARTNDDLTRTNDDLAKANEDLTGARAVQAKTYEVLKNARAGLIKQTNELIEANESAGERGYLSDIALAHQLWKANDLRGMRAALERCPENRRRWEWHYLDRISRPARAVLATDSVPMALEYSPGGKRLAYLTMGGTLTVRELATGGESSYTVDLPQGTKRTIAFHPDGNELAFSVGNRYWTAKLAPWEVKEITPKDKDGKRLPIQSVLALAYTKDGLLLADAPYPGIGAEWVFLIRDALTGKTVATLGSGVKPPLVVVVDAGGAAFSPDGARFAASLVDSGIRVGLQGQTEKVEPFRSVVAAWNVGSGKRLRRVEGGMNGFGQLAFSSDGKLLGFGDNSRVLELDAAPDELVVRPLAQAMAVAFHRDGRIWSGGEDKLISAVDYSDGLGWGEDRFVLRGCPNTVVRLASAPDGKEVAAASGDLLSGPGTVHRFDVASLAADVWRAPAARNRMSTVGALSPDGKKFAAIDFSLGGEKQPAPRLVIRDVGTGTERKVDSSTNWPRVALRPDGGLVLLEDNQRPDRKEWLRFRAADGKLEGQVDLPVAGRVEPLSILAVTRDGKTVAAVGSMRFPAKEGERQPIGARVTTWDTATRVPGKSFEAKLSEVIPNTVKNVSLYPTAAVFSADGQKLAATFVLAWEKDRGGMEYRGIVLVWDAATGAEVFQQIVFDPMRAVCFGPDGTLVTAGGSITGGVVYGWNLTTNERSFVMPAHTRPVVALAFGPDGRLVTGGSDRAVKVWDVASRREILALDGFSRDVTHLAFTADGKNLVVATGIDRFDAMTTFGAVPDWAPAEVRVFRGPK